MQLLPELTIMEMICDYSRQLLWDNLEPSNLKEFFSMEKKEEILYDYSKRKYNYF